MGRNRLESSSEGSLRSPKENVDGRAFAALGIVVLGSCPVVLACFPSSLSLKFDFYAKNRRKLLRWGGSENTHFGFFPKCFLSQNRFLKTFHRVQPPESRCFPGITGITLIFSLVGRIVSGKCERLEGESVCPDP